jgi:ankyrin repeat protein
VIVPATAGVQARLVEELCRAGAASNGPGDDGEPLWTAITFGYTDAAEALVRCGARVDNVVFAAALGDLASVRRFFDEAGKLKPGRARSTRRLESRRSPLRADRMLEYGLIWAALHGRREVCSFLLDKQPDLSFTEPFFGSTAIGAARYHGHHEVVAMLESAMPEQNRRRG